VIDILIADDDAERVGVVLSLLEKTSGIDVKTVACVIDAKRELSERSFDLLLLDLQMPLRFGDMPKPNGGINLLRDLSRIESRLHRPHHIIGITAFEDLERNNKSFFEDELWALLFYRRDSTDWSKRLMSKIAYLDQSKKSLVTHIEKNFDYDVAIIAALENPELTALRRTNNGRWERLENSSDDTIYHSAEVKRDDGTIVRIVAASAPQKGMASSCFLSAKMLGHFRPRLLCMTGICAGVKGKNNFGDIVVASQSWDYESGKIVQLDSGLLFKPEPQTIPIDPGIAAELQFMAGSSAIFSKIQEQWQGERYPTALQLHVGPMATGAAVLQAISMVDRIKEVNRNCIAIEMEAYGVMYAAYHAQKPKPKCIVAKSVCDFADHDKSDNHQAYASYTSAAFIMEYIRNHMKIN
jgi:nucleoside phosphorylase